MLVTRLRARADVDLLAADLGRFPAVWPAYQRGLHEVYTEIGAADLAMGPELPTGVTTVVIATGFRCTQDGHTVGDHTVGDGMVGGVLLRERTEIGRYTGLVRIADAIAERTPEGVNEIGGCWLRPGWRRAGLGTALVREAVRTAAGRVRWTVALANQFSVGISVHAGFVPDTRFQDLPFPDNRFRSTLCWFDHHREGS